MTADALRFENEAETEGYALDEKQLDRGVLTTPYDAPVRTLLLEIQDKSLVVNPAFQRHSVWNRTKQSRLIESLLMNIPIPVLYFAEDQDGTRVVVDGQQRLRAIEEFYRGTYALHGLQVLRQLNGRRWADLSPKHANILLRRTLRCVVISASSPESLRFEMFERLNTGGVQLNDQELRNCIFHGRFNDMLKQLSREPVWLAALGLRRGDQRMRDMEMALRFFMLRECFSTYRPPLKEALNEYMKTHRNPTDDELAGFRDCLIGTVQKVQSVFGPASFKRARLTEEFEVEWDRAMNRAVFDIQMLSFETLDANQLQNKAEQVRNAFTELCAQDFVFQEAISLATADRSSVLTRLRIWGKTLEGLDLPPAYLPQLPQE